MLPTVMVLLIGLELKHFIADYTAQTNLMMEGKANLRHPGGYLHAGVHVLGTLLVLLLVMPPLWLVAAILAAEFVVHYALDYAKVHYSRGITPTGRPKAFWVLHGLDQLLHQLTYAAIIYAVLAALYPGA